MAKIPCGIRIPDTIMTEVADLLWHGSRPTDPPLVPGNPDSDPPVVEVPAPPLTDKQCIDRWIRREIIGRLIQHRKEVAALAAVAAADASVTDLIE